MITADRPRILADDEPAWMFVSVEQAAQRIGEYLPVQWGSTAIGCKLIRVERDQRKHRIAIVQQDGSPECRVHFGMIDWSHDRPGENGNVY